MELDLLECIKAIRGMLANMEDHISASQLAVAPLRNAQQTELAIAARELLDYLDGNAEHGESQEVLVENLRDALQKQALCTVI